MRREEKIDLLADQIRGALLHDEELPPMEDVCTISDGMGYGTMQERGGGNVKAAYYKNARRRRRRRRRRTTTMPTASLRWMSGPRLYDQTRPRTPPQKPRCPLGLGSRHMELCLYFPPSLVQKNALKKPSKPP